jgi:hypothetical protein
VSGNEPVGSNPNLVPYIFKTNFDIVEFQVFASVTMKNTLLWNVILRVDV